MESGWKEGKKSGIKPFNPFTGRLYYREFNYIIINNIDTNIISQNGTSVSIPSPDLML